MAVEGDDFMPLADITDSERSSEKLFEELETYNKIVERILGGDRVKRNGVTYCVVDELMVRYRWAERYFDSGVDLLKCYREKSLSPTQMGQVLTEAKVIASIIVG
jgi:hypothetical protein